MPTIAGSPKLYPENTDDMSTTQQESQQAENLFPTPHSSHSFYPSTYWQPKAAGQTVSQARAPNPNPAALDFMQLSPAQTDSTRPSIPNHNDIPAPLLSSATLIDPMLFISPYQPQGASLENTRPSDTLERDVDSNPSYPRLPSDLQDMLSGFFTA